MNNEPDTSEAAKDLRSNFGSRGPLPETDPAVLFERKRRAQYGGQRITALQRGIQFTLTFEDWCDIWDKSGHYDKRGVGIGKYCMSRIKDEGPYSVENVFIQLHRENSVQGQDKRVYPPNAKAPWRNEPKDHSKYGYSTTKDGKLHRRLKRSWIEAEANRLREQHGRT